MPYRFAFPKRRFHQSKTPFSPVKDYVFIDQKHSLGSYVAGDLRFK